MGEHRVPLGVRAMRLRIGVLLAVALVLAALPASAQEDSGGRTYVAEASSTALQITINGEGLRLGDASAAVRSDAEQEGCEGEASACAAAASLAGYNDTSASSPDDEGPNDGTGGEIPEDFSPLLSGTIAEALARAGAADAAGQANGADLSINLTETILGDEQAEPLREGLADLSEGLFGPIAEGDPSGEIGPRLKSTFDLLVENLANAPLATVEVLPSASEAADSSEAVTASAQAKGAVITVAPTSESNPLTPEGFLIIEVGAAAASVSAGGEQGAQASADPAVARLRIYDAEADAYEEVAVAAGDYQCGGEAPLVGCVGAGSAETTENEDGAAARAAGVSVRLFEEPAPEVVIEVAGVQAGAAETPAAPPAEPAGGPLPTTGAAVWPGLVLLGGGALSGLALRRRTLRR